MPSNVIQISSRPRCRVLIAHQNRSTRRELKSLIETEGMAVIEVADGESALAELQIARFDLLLLELDLPECDGLTVMKLHRMLLANQAVRADPPAVIFSLPVEVRNTLTLTDHLYALGAEGLIVDPPGDEVRDLVASILNARECRAAAGKPAAA